MMKRSATLLFLFFLFEQAAHANGCAAVSLKQISAHVWVHTSCESINGYPTDSNGLIIDCPHSLVMVDTCWSDDETRVLLKMLKELFNKPVSFVIITHAHSDRIGGIRALLKEGIKVIATLLTAKMAAEAGYPSPSPDLKLKENTLTIGDMEVDAFFPGAGHTKDNEVVWIPRDRVLFGGCLIKPRLSRNLGNTADADLGAWPNSIRALEAKYPSVQIVVPGHGAIGGKELLRHTMELCTSK
jgi:metallo-beta-lactamase class B